MNKKGQFIKLYGALAVILIAVYLVLIFHYLGSVDNKQLNLVQVNDIVKTVEENWELLSTNNEGNSVDLIKTIETTDSMNSLNYAITTITGDILSKTPNSNYHSLNQSITNRDTIIDLNVDNQPVGKVIIENDTGHQLREIQHKLEGIGILFVVVIAIIEVVYLMLLYHNIIKPFELLKNFATSVAIGNYDLPLKMDRNNLFGAFTESFDIMREELMISKERERKIAQSKKELVASLSHDIKTPVASIKAIAELMQAQGKDEQTSKQIQIIETKADQIELLINNLFHSALEEMNELKVETTEENSSILKDMILTSDFYKKVRDFTIPECLIYCDKLRMQQVVDNIINNSYKYANTELTIHCEILDKRLLLTIQDYGKTSIETEVPLLCEKFFRGSNTNGKTGSGIGLYISKYFMNKMNGNLEVQQNKDGFMVLLTICMP